MSHLPADPSCPSNEDGSRARLLVLVGLGLTLALTGWATSEPSSQTQAGDTSEATVVFDFGGAREEAPQVWEQTVTYDPDKRPAEDTLNATNATGPDAYTAHDLLADLREQTETALQVTHEEELGYRLGSVQGIPAEPSPERWTLYVDDEEETASLNTITVEEDATYEWRMAEAATDEAGSDAERERQTADGGDEEPTTRENASRDGPSGGSDTDQATVIVDYNGFRNEDPQRTEHVVRYDPDARPTLHRYEEADTGRPDAYILHDLVSDWSNETGTDHIAREHDDTGFRLNTVDGVTAHSTQGGAWRWTLAVDDEPETASLTAIRVQHGSTYEWTFERTSGGGGQ
jgi:hypothetical protein